MDKIEILEKRLREIKEELEKSNYGPKGASQYDVADNVNRKMRNTGDQTGVGQNINTKAYSTKPGQLSAKATAAQIARKDKIKSAKNPVKIYSEEEKAALAEKMKLNKEEHLEKDFANKELSDKNQKIKELQTKIDAGTYKPSPKKIADKMLKEELICSQNGQWSLNTK